MTKIAVRHGISLANDGRPSSFMRHDAPLTVVGIVQAIKLGERIEAEFGITPCTTPVKCTEFPRTQQTATKAGFRFITSDALLNEVPSEMSPDEFTVARANRLVPRTALKAAEMILNAPPVEQVLITSALIIVGITELLGLTDRYENFIPGFCEARELPI